MDGSLLKIPGRRSASLSEFAGPADPQFSRCEAAHSLFGFHPRAVRRAPAGTVEHPDFGTRLLGLPNSMLRALPPSVTYLPAVDHFTVLLTRAYEIWARIGDIAGESLIDTGLGHRFEVSGDALLGDVVVYPMPVE